MGKKNQGKVRFYMQTNDGKIKRIKRFKDKDEEDTKITFYTQIERKDGTKSKLEPLTDFIFTEDMEGATDTEPDNKNPIIEVDDLIQQKTGETFTINTKISDPDGQIKEIIWQQIEGEPLQMSISEDKKSVTITSTVKGDYVITVQAIDDKDKDTIVAIKIKIRDEIIPNPNPEPSKYNYVSQVVGSGDFSSDTKGIQTIKALGKIKAETGVKIFGNGDFEYGTDIDGFIQEWNNAGLDTDLTTFGNHDDVREDGKSQEVTDKVNQYFGFNNPAVSTKVVGTFGFIMMDSQDEKIGDVNGTQYKFVEEKLKLMSEDNNITHIGILIHKPFFSTGYKHEDLKSREIYHNLFLQYEVDFVIQSHNHNNWITYPLASDLKVNKEKGVRYIGIGSGGRQLYDIGSDIPDFIEWSNDSDFCYLDIGQAQENKMVARARFIITQNGETLKDFYLTNKATTTDPDINNPPNAQDMTVKTYINEGITIRLMGSDKDVHDTLTYSIVNPAVNGTITLVQNNEIAYVPNTDFQGSDSFTYTCSDGEFTSRVALVSIVVAEKTTGELGLPLRLEDADMYYHSKNVWLVEENISGHHKFSKQDKQTEIAAGDNTTGLPDWSIRKNEQGDFVSYICGARKRIYTWRYIEDETDGSRPDQKGYKYGTTVSIIRFVPNQSVENWSYETFSRHNAGGAEENRKGLIGIVIHKGEIEFKEELYHKKYVSHGTQKLKKPLEFGKPVTVAMLVSIDEDLQCHAAVYFDRENDGSFDLEMSTKFKIGISKAAMDLPALYARWRTNNESGMPKNAEIQELRYGYFENKYLPSTL